MTYDEIYKSRPFKVRNADEYELEQVLNLFVSPVDGLKTPFDYENTIIKGRMGSGKTMYLRANHAYYLYSIVPSLLTNDADIILPVFIRLSDFQHITQPKDVYSAVIIKIIEELTNIYLRLQDAKHMAELHKGMKVIPHNFLAVNQKLSKVLIELSKLGSDEYVERLNEQLGLNGGLKSAFLELSSSYKEEKFSEIKKKPNPGIKDVEECYKTLLSDQKGQILLLIDEAGSLDKSFFLSEGEGSFFEILMNQLRTSSFIRTKIAVYPHSYSDMLTETRYGDEVKLEENVFEERSYNTFRVKVIALMNNYLNPDEFSETKYMPQDFFELNEKFGDGLEQLIYASYGNMRRLIQLFDASMNKAFIENNRPQQVKLSHVIEALKDHALSTENLFTQQEQEFLHTIVSACKSRGAFKFEFPYKSPILYKYTSKSSEYNILNIELLGTGRRSTIYSFDYAYCILEDIPTHYLNNSEKYNKDRSIGNGRWINRTAKINEQVIEEATLPNKIEGEFGYIKDSSGFIQSDSGEEYFFTSSNIVSFDKEKTFSSGKRARFFPLGMGDTKVAVNIEVLS